VPYVMLLFCNSYAGFRDCDRACFLSDVTAVLRLEVSLESIDMQHIAPL
jgi:hypothetical protein